MKTENHQKVVDECTRLLKIDHQDHEDIIRFLQASEDPYSIPFLREAALLKPHLNYLRYDDYGSYYKKCFWALRAINTPESISAIREFVTSEDFAAKRQAIYRLSKIEGESM